MRQNKNLKQKALINKKQIFKKENTFRMLPSNEDKKLLIESMKKLTHHISNNPVRQKQIFDSLARNDLLKIISNLTDDNQCTQTNIQEEFLGYFCQSSSTIMMTQSKGLLNYCRYFHPKEGSVQIKYRHKYKSTHQLLKVPTQLTEECIELMKSPLKQQQTDKFCWTINLDRKVLQIEFLDYKKYSSFTFLDPNRNIFGFTAISKTKKQELRKHKYYDNNSKQKNVKSIDSRNSSKKESFGINNSFYKNYLEFRNRKTNSPNSYKDNYQKKDFNKPNTSRNHKNQYLANSYKNINTSQNVSPYPKNSRQTLGTPKRQSYDYRVHLNSSHESLQFGSSGLKSPIGSSYRQVNYGFREPQTDRKHDTAYRYKVSNCQIYGSTEKSRYPETTKNSSINNMQQQKFYKRVKEILKR